MQASRHSSILPPRQWIVWSWATPTIVSVSWYSCSEASPCITNHFLMPRHLPHPSALGHLSWPMRFFCLALSLSMSTHTCNEYARAELDEPHCKQSSDSQG